MNIQELNVIFQSKYPEGLVTQRGKFGDKVSSVAVIYNSNGKVYEYSYKSYADLLVKLGFPVIYKKQLTGIQKRISELKAEIEAGGYEDIFSEEFIPYTVVEINNLKHELEHQKTKLNYAVV